MVQLNLYQIVHGYSTGGMYQNGYTPSPCTKMCRVMFLLAGGGGGGGLEIWSALGAILGLLMVSS